MTTSKNNNKDLQLNTIGVYSLWGGATTLIMDVGIFICGSSTNIVQTSQPICKPNSFVIAQQCWQSLWGGWWGAISL